MATISQRLKRSSLFWQFQEERMAPIIFAKSCIYPVLSKCLSCKLFGPQFLNLIASSPLICLDHGNHDWREEMELKVKL